MSGVADKLRKRRLSAGALELASSELHFEATPEGAAGFAAKRDVPMMAVVAEFMILANAVVGEFLAATWPRGALLRRHAAPRGDSVAGAAVSKLCSGVGVDVGWGTG